jgi:hypothetical protein
MTYVSQKGSFQQTYFMTNIIDKLTAFIVSISLFIKFI